MVLVLVVVVLHVLPVVVVVVLLPVPGERDRGLAGQSRHQETGKT
jgi:hypothetical protein